MKPTTDIPSLVAYLLVVAIVAWLTYAGKCPPEVFSALCAVSVPQPWKRQE